ncbi:KpsF/GutQ family sugar-phosphate isomerase [Terriglobus aquaticus]|uniref:SIS domain-containing protein n=1 Tax=Terriglobus aquaticus TaxID=940139 RepID=A0ABW9KK40_9BACT|nr:KpsF/GutQ family sugar-phosphate isomerase [Terriglobus aquaticus]
MDFTGALEGSRDALSAIETVTCELRGLQQLRDALGGALGETFSTAVQVLAAVTGRILVTGVGKSGHIARKIAGTFASTGRPAHFLHPADASHGDLGTVRPEDAVYALSWSGESAELADLLAYTRRFRVPLIAATACPDSTLGRAADVTLALPHADEACPDSLAPTTSTTMQLALGDALAVALLARSGFTADDFRNYHPGGKLGSRLLRVRDLMHTGDEVPTVSADVSLSEAIVRMTSGRFGVTGLINADGSLLGILTDGDLRRAFNSGMHDRPAREAMTRHPRTAEPETLATAALAEMNERRITSLFVVESGRPIGILHIHDLLRAGLV